MAPHRDHPARHPGLLAGPRVRLEPGVRGLQLGQGGAAFKPGGIGIDAQAAQLIALGPALRRLCGQPEADVSAVWPSGPGC